MRLYLIRHAESANNAVYGTDAEFSGHSPDPEITETGQKQGVQLGEHAIAADNEPRQHPFETQNQINYGFTHLYCSLMTRSILTAEYIANAYSLPLTARDDIFERLGIHTFDEGGNRRSDPGPSRSYFEERFPSLQLPAWLNDQGWWNRPVESDNDFFARVKTSLNKIIQEHGDTNHSVAMVVHGDYIDQCVNELMGVERTRQNYEKKWVANWVFHNTSISRLDVEGDSRQVVYLNRIDHLHPALVTW
jgi:2,3-bisphosphoglycerate-dependent phosphoglycerate mutase